MDIFSLFKKDNEREKFAKRVIAHFKLRQWPSSLTYDKVKFALYFGDNQTLFLQNVFDDWQMKTPSAQLDYLDYIVNFSTNLLTAEDSVEDLSKISADILPTLRNRGFIENMWMQEGFNSDGPKFTHSHSVFCGHMSHILAVNNEYGITTCNDHNYETWGVTFASLQSLAMQNLRAQKSIKFERHVDGFYYSGAEDYFDASLPLLPEAFEKIDLNGHPIAIVVSRSRVFVSGSNETNIAEKMVAAALEEFENEVRPISCAPIVLINGQWSEMTNFDGALSPYRRLKIEQSLFDYREQHILLESYFERTGRDTFVADILTLTPPESSDKYALSTVAYQVKALMPKVDALIIQGDTDEMLIRAWDDVLEVCGPKQVEPSTYPVRLLFEDGISDQEWAILKSDYICPPQFRHLQ